MILATTPKYAPPPGRRLRFHGHRSGSYPTIHMPPRQSVCVVCRYRTSQSVGSIAKGSSRADNGVLNVMILSTTCSYRPHP